MGPKRSPSKGDKGFSLKEKVYIAKEISTSITILESPEENVVIDALLFLSKFADVDPSNLYTLQMGGIIPKLIALLEKGVPVVRLSLRLISVLLNCSNTVEELDQEKYNPFLLEVCNMLIDDEDCHIKEFAAAVLVALAKTPRVITLVYTSKIYAPLFSMLKTASNPVLLTNVLKLLYNMLDAPTAITALANEMSFEPAVLQNHMNNFFHDITYWVLEIFRKLTFFGVAQIQSLFKDSKLVENMFEIIINPDRAVYHKKAFEIVIYCTNSEETGVYFIDSLEFIEFCQWSKTCPNGYLLSIATILEKLASQPPVRQVLFDLSVEDAILSLLRALDSKTLVYVDLAIAHMTSHKYCCEKMLTPIVIKEAVRHIEKLEMDDTVYEAGIKLINYFCKRNIKTFDMLYEYGGFPILIKYFAMGAEKMPEETYRRVMEIMILIFTKRHYQHLLLTPEFYKTIFRQFKSGSDEICHVCLEIMTYCLPNKSFRDHFVQNEGPKMVLERFKQTKVKELLKYMLVFIHNNLLYKKLAQNFLTLGLVHILKAFKNSNQDVPIIPRMLALLYNLYLPLKFFETNKLEVGDRVISPFYIISGVWKWHFPFLEILAAKHVCTRNTIFLVDISFQPPLDSIGSLWKIASATTTANVGRMSSDDFQLSDRFLYEYIIELRKKLEGVREVEAQVKIIAEFVDIQMCGPSEDFNQIEKLHEINLHIEALKRKLESNVIPIGYLRIGVKCHRALLFKALADYFFIPCTLQKSGIDIYWNEIGIAQMSQSDCSIRYFVLDLMENVGELLPVGSTAANYYCSNR